jgi:hypothetical protein
MTLESRQFNYLAWLTGVGFAVLLGGALFALVTQQISFQVFAATVGSPVSALVGWAARGATVPKA